MRIITKLCPMGIIALALILGTGCSKEAITRTAVTANPDGSVMPVSQELYHAGNCAQSSQGSEVDPRCLVY